MTVIKSYVVKIDEADPSGGLSTVYTDGVTIEGDGSQVNPVKIKTGYLGSAALEDSSAFDASGSAAAALSAANIYTDSAVGTKQNTLVSGTNIKTINGDSVLGSGNITIAAQKTFAVCFSDPTSAITAGVGKVEFPAPYDMTLTGIFAGLKTPQASGSILTIDVNKIGVTMLSTKITIDNTEDTSLTATTQPVISVSSFLKGDMISIDVDQVGDGSAVLGTVVFEG